MTQCEAHLSLGDVASRAAPGQLLSLAKGSLPARHFAAVRPRRQSLAGPVL